MSTLKSSDSSVSLSSCECSSTFTFKNVLVAGLGVSGRGAVEVLRAVGSNPITADEKKPEADTVSYTHL